MTVEVVNAGGTVQHLESYFIATPPVTSLSRQLTTSNGSQVLFSIPFPYINPTHVVVLVGGIAIQYPAWSFVDPTHVQLSGPQAAGVLVEVRRVTPATALVTYTDGAVLTGADLNLGVLQNLYLIQEWQDLYGAALGGALTQVAGYQGPVVVTPAEMIAAVADQVLSSSLATALANRIDDIDLNALSVSVGSSAAAILTEATARANGDTSLASLITTLTSTVAGNTASIATNATTVSGLSAQYTVKVDVNGHVAGFGLASLPVNGATVSSFIVQANNFSIVDPGNGLSAPIVPFSVVGGVVFMNSVVINGALIQNATITNAQIANLTVGTTQLAGNCITMPKLAPGITTGPSSSTTYTGSISTTATIPAMKSQMVLELFADSGLGAHGNTTIPTLGGGGGAGGYCKSVYDVSASAGLTVNIVLQAGASNPTASTISSGTFAITTMSIAGGFSGTAGTASVNGNPGDGGPASTGGNLVNQSGDGGRVGVASNKTPGRGITGTYGNGNPGGVGNATAATNNPGLPAIAVVTFI